MSSQQSDPRTHRNSGASVGGGVEGGGGGDKKCDNRGVEMTVDPGSGGGGGGVALTSITLENIEEEADGSKIRFL